MMKIDDYQKTKNAAYKKFGADGYLIEPDNNDIIIKLLKIIFPDDCDFNAVTEFCLKRNYGRGKNNKIYVDPDGQDVNMSSPEELYDYIVSTIT